MKTVITTILLGLIINCGLKAQTMIQDTLIYETSYNDTFNLKPYEAAVCVYKIPADGIILGFNVPIAANDSNNIIRVEIYSLNYPNDSSGNQYSTNYVDENGWLGYYPSIFNDTVPFWYPDWGQIWNEFGDIGICARTELVPHSQDPLNSSIWIGGIAPYYIWTTGNHWMDFEDSGYQYQVQQDEYIGILLYHYLPDDTYEDTTRVVTFQSNNAAEINNPYPLLVFSPSCRGISGEGGWHIRSAVINCELAIEYESVSTESEPELPASFVLMPNYPNPFNPVTTIDYQIPKPVYVNLSVYNLAGQLVRTLVKEPKDAGFHTVEWSAGEVGSGVYIYRLSAGEYVAVKKCIVIK